MNRQVNPTPVIPYRRLVGEVLQARRLELNLHQRQLASALGITQSGYSRIEKGETTISVSQLRIVAGILRTLPSDLLVTADLWARQLRARGVTVSDEKEISPAAILIALGILTALIASTS